ncbi:MULTISPECIES: hypothetical protein [unclassified Rhodanobacter]|uniref:hypothetical protein n=1 Tax=unclassified Rhodanobacter TaxID=2621553 RepID=UPI001BE0E187|nr:MULTISPECIES: hypothetical protein [unclassified Rhodanobacter]MBT2144474.1 hypothetical protein [Rhodanobacter sp. LX-99]MBT2149859.1 hypothetical protein [Rhodanobacter sp. LX-100]
MLTLGALLPASLLAADAQQAVKARPGDVVLLADVSTRPAHHPAPPGMALMVDPSPRYGIARALGRRTAWRRPWRNRTRQPHRPRAVAANDTESRASG